MKTIFLCSRYRGNVERNRQRAKYYARLIALEGHIPIAPHLFYPQFLDDANPNERMIGINLGLNQLKGCDEMWIFGTIISDGMKLEIEKAKENGIPVRLHDENGKVLNPDLISIDERCNSYYRNAVQGLKYIRP